MFVNILQHPDWPMPPTGMTARGVEPPPTEWPVWWASHLDWRRVLDSTAHRVTGLRTGGAWSLIIVREHIRVGAITRGIRALPLGDTSLRVVDDETGEDRVVQPDATALRHFIHGARERRIDQVVDEYQALREEAQGKASNSLALALRGSHMHPLEHSGWLPPQTGEPPTMGVVSLTPPPQRLLARPWVPSDPSFTYCPMCLGVYGSHDPGCDGVDAPAMDNATRWAVMVRLARYENLLTSATPPRPLPAGQPGEGK